MPSGAGLINQYAEQRNTSVWDACHAAAAPVDKRSFVTVTLDADEAVTTVTLRSAVALGANSWTAQFQPLAAVGIPTTPLDAVPPVPTLTRKIALPLFDAMLGLVPNPLDIVGAVALYNSVPLTCNEVVALTVVALTLDGVVAPIAALSMAAPLIVPPVMATAD